MALELNKSIGEVSDKVSGVVPTNLKETYKENIVGSLEDPKENITSQVTGALSNLTGSLGDIASNTLNNITGKVKSILPTSQKTASIRSSLENRFTSEISTYKNDLQIGNEVGSIKNALQSQITGLIGALSNSKLKGMSESLDVKNSILGGINSTAQSNVATDLVNNATSDASATSDTNVEVFSEEIKKPAKPIAGTLEYLFPDPKYIGYFRWEKTIIQAFQYTELKYNNFNNIYPDAIKNATGSSKKRLQKNYEGHQKLAPNTTYIITPEPSVGFFSDILYRPLADYYIFTKENSSEVKTYIHKLPPEWEGKFPEELIKIIDI